MDIFQKLQKEFNLKPFQVENTVNLIDEGNTIPFIARYRKEVTGSLDDVTLRNFFEKLNYLRNLEDKKAQTIKLIDVLGKLTLEVKQKIENSETLTEIEDIYRPFRPKRKTRAIIAESKGLKPLSEVILKQKLEKPVEELAKEFLNPKLEVNSIEDAIFGAQDIIAEEISDNPDYRKFIREKTYSKGIITVKAKDKDLKSVYEMYYEYNEQLSKIPRHRILAINRGEKEKILSVKIEPPVELILNWLNGQIIIENSETASILKDTIIDGYKRLISPSIEREIRNSLTEKAEEGAISVFSKNLKQLLLQPPIKGKVVLGWDPAFRTGCKLAVVDETGKLLDKDVVYPTEPHNKTLETKKTVKELVNNYNIDIIAIGNGTASRESEIIVSELLKELDRNLKYVIVNEAGASVYSASELGFEEFPEYDVGVRSAASIARRLQDPLAELVKIDPKSIGVGQYQHDMNQKKLSESLGAVVESCVNSVGVDLNTASVSLLNYVSGINKEIAKNIVNYRIKNGKFNSRKELLNVKKLGKKAFEQCAGFLRIQNGKNLLDNTSVHPESYKIAENLLNELNLSLNEINYNKMNKISEKIESIKDIKNIEKLADKLNTGIPTLLDIIRELEKPGRDPRDDVEKPVLRSDVLKFEDLKEGMILKGTIRNIVDFGAFVDIGVHHDGLIHISEVSDRFIKHPLEVISVGDVVNVFVLGIDFEKNRVSLSIKKAINF
ncbi:RNA binding S1 domain protein [Methanococcus vannielii SB]|uniref:RNA binding S1 domain protein n=1 Tax=Methanococcus vannielii (strain ATCC 35089 / DSM 1224 / JCM 13029 / OCM 148 / SB) TaxID=406327 RepID=A6UPD5_METVS|nr:Tex family protein [Methanococcus vannielii]ABR54357.1 RNA binding S1 domain protein [Methanococcus vannielii SB]